MKKIAIFTDTFSPDVNGVARTLKRLTDYFETLQIEYRVFAPESTKESRFNSHIHRFTSLPFHLYPECRIGFPNMFTINSELQKFKPDLIHIATPFNLGLAGLHFAKKLNIPVVGSYHTDFDYYLDFYDLRFLSNIIWRYMHWFHRPFEKIFVPSKETITVLRKHGFTNLHIWSRGVDCQLFHPFYQQNLTREKYRINEKFIFTYVGRLAPEKDVNTLMKIAHSLPESIKPNVHWLIIGDGPSKSEMVKKAPTNMTFAGYLAGEQLAQAYSNSDLFIFPSPTETFGNVVLESLACGTPVIGANSGGVKSIIRHNSNGMLCSPHDHEDFISAIILLIENSHLRNKMGTEGRKYAITQSWDAIFDNLIDHYHEVVNNRTHRYYA